MTAEQALRKALIEIHRQDTGYSSVSAGTFYGRAPSGTVLPYSTFTIVSGVPLRSMRGTWGWKFVVQVKHWGADSKGIAANEITQHLKDASGALLHARDTDDYDRGAEDVLSELNALTCLDGWEFSNAEIVNTIPLLSDQIGDAEVWCQGHVFEFWLGKAA